MAWSYENAIAFLSSIQGWSIILIAVSYIPYIYAVVWGGKTPTLSAWVTFLVFDGVILGAMLMKGEVLNQMYFYTGGCALTLIACLCMGAWDWRPVDTYCMIAAGGALVLWFLTAEPNVAIFISLVALSAGSLPMIGNIRREPEREHWLPWALNLSGGALSIIAVDDWVFAKWSSPVVFTGLSVVVNFLLWRAAWRSSIWRKRLDVVLLRD